MSRFLTSLSLICLVSSCSKSNSNIDSNEQYLKETLGSIILEYQKDTGRLPNTFTEALKKSNKKLSHRGDINGNSMVYEKVNEDQFYIMSYGRNNKFEHGKGDDLILFYTKESWKRVQDLPQREWENW